MASLPSSRHGARLLRGWPRLGEPIVRYRGRFCYVSALLPGHREPTPILRLRYQGSADRWATGIYLASSGQYTESELPASLGPKTGTTEEGFDDTFILHAGPKPATCGSQPAPGSGPGHESAKHECLLETDFITNLSFFILHLCFLQFRLSVSFVERLPSAFGLREQVLVLVPTIEILLHLFPQLVTREARLKRLI